MIERQLRDRAPAHLEFPAHGIGRDRARGTAEDRVHRSGNRPALGEIDLDELREERVGIWVVILDNLQTLGKGERLRITECFSGEVVKAERADEMHVAADPVEFGRNDRALRLSGSRQRRSELRTTVERVEAFAGFNLDMLCDQSEPFRCCEPLDRGFLSLNPQSGFALTRRGNPVITALMGSLVQLRTPANLP